MIGLTLIMGLNKTMKQIESYHISKSEYGIITLIVNTKVKWVHYDFSEGNTDNWLRTIDEQTNTYSDTLTITYSELGFDKEKEGRYHRLEQQDKDQIVFYWIPLRLLRGDEYVEHFKSKIHEIQTR